MQLPPPSFSETIPSHSSNSTTIPLPRVEGALLEPINKLLHKRITLIGRLREREIGLPITLFHLLEKILEMTSPPLQGARLSLHGSGSIYHLGLPFAHQAVERLGDPRIIAIAKERLPGMIKRPADLDVKISANGGIFSLEKRLHRDYFHKMAPFPEAFFSHHYRTSPRYGTERYIHLQFVFMDKEEPQRNFLDLFVHQQLHHEALHDDQIILPLDPLFQRGMSSFLEPYSAAGCALYLRKIYGLFDLTAPSVNSNGWARTLERIAWGERLLSHRSWERMVASLATSLWHTKGNDADDLLSVLDHRMSRNGIPPSQLRSNSIFMQPSIFWKWRTSSVRIVFGKELSKQSYRALVGMIAPFSH